MLIIYPCKRFSFLFHQKHMFKIHSYLAYLETPEKLPREDKDKMLST